MNNYYDLESNMVEAYRANLFEQILYYPPRSGLSSKRKVKPSENDWRPGYEFLTHE